LRPQSDSNVFRGNTANNNTGWGFFIGGLGDTPVNGTLFERNVANNNGWYGFGASLANGNTWTRNTATSNGYWGFLLWDSCSGNTVSGNVGRTNGEYDAYDRNDPVNNWANNNFGTASPAGLS
jgi:parallel beta-helix repeat protein